MSDTPLKQQLLEMSLEGIESVIDIIRSRPDIQGVFLITKKESDEMSKHFKDLVERIPDEPA